MPRDRDLGSLQPLERTKDDHRFKSFGGIRCQFGWQLDAHSRRFEGVVANSRFPERAGMREWRQFATLILPVWRGSEAPGGSKQAAKPRVRPGAGSRILPEGHFQNFARELLSRARAQADSGLGIRTRL